LARNRGADDGAIATKRARIVHALRASKTQKAKKYFHESPDKT
jgi:hypothetical protein